MFVCDNRLIVDLCGSESMITNIYSDSTISGTVALKSRLLRQAGYRVLFINVSPLCTQAIDSLHHWVMTNDITELSNVLSSLSFRISPLGVIIPCTYENFLLQSTP